MNEDFSEVKPWLQPRSKGSDINSRAFYRFVNCTGFEVELFWLDFDGNRVRQQISFWATKHYHISELHCTALQAEKFIYCRIEFLAL